MDATGFRFGDITEIRDVNLLPGAAKYGDVPALLALCAPTPLTISEATPPLTAAAYGVAPDAAPVRAGGDESSLVEHWLEQWTTGDEDSSKL